MTAGKKPSAVSPVESLTREPLDAHVFHLKMTFEAHQKLATLSSNRPRAKGNILVIGWRVADKLANGGSHGRNNNRKVEVVTRARRMKSCKLGIELVRKTKEGLIQKKNIPIYRAKVDAFSYEVGTNGRRII
jgi:hypothetical protein